MEGLEEEDELEVLGDLLELGAQRGDGDELGDVEQEGESEDGDEELEGDGPEGLPPGLLVPVGETHCLPVEGSQERARYCWSVSKN